MAKIREPRWDGEASRAYQEQDVIIVSQHQGLKWLEAEAMEEGT